MNASFPHRYEVTLTGKGSPLGALKVNVRRADTKKASRLLDMAKKHCIVSNSLRQPVEVEGSIVAA